MKLSLSSRVPRKIMQTTAQRRHHYRLWKSKLRESYGTRHLPPSWSTPPSYIPSTALSKETRGAQEPEASLPKRKKIDLRTAARIAFISIIIVAIVIICVIAYNSSFHKTAQLSAYSDKWNDISKFRASISAEGYEVASIISSPTMLNYLDHPSKSLLVIMGVEKEYSYSEGKAIHEFLTRGGKMILADDFGYANSITEPFFRVTFNGHRLWDTNFDKNPAFVKINVNCDFFSGVIVLNEPTCIAYSEGTELAYSTQDSWVDENDNLVRDCTPLEPFGEFPVIIESAVGEQGGKAIFISDSSIFINDLWVRTNNSEFAKSLVAYLLPEGGKVIFDESRHIRGNLIDNAQQSCFESLVRLTTDQNLRIVAGTITLLILGIIIVGLQNPSLLYHRQYLGYYKLRNLYTYNVTYHDCNRIRRMLLERVRLTHGYSPDDFRALSSSELATLIKDPELAEFAINWSREYYGDELERILLKIQRIK